MMIVVGFSKANAQPDNERPLFWPLTRKASSCNAVEGAFFAARTVFIIKVS
jgi:hypothetical protein